MDATTTDLAGTIARSSTVVKSTAGSAAVRRVEITVPRAIPTGDSCWAASRNDTSARAATGGNSPTPSSSRNFT